VVTDNIKIAAILQARMGSTRFPGKVLSDIAGKPLISHIVQRIRATEKINTIILATTKLQDDDELASFAKKNEIHCYRGEVDDVLARFYGAATQYKIDIIIRICCDDPLIDHIMLNELIDLHIETHSDYTSTSHVRTFPMGIEAEVFNYNILEKAFNCANKEYEREHVTPYIYENPDLFKISFLEATGKLRRPDLRLTVDTQEDMKLVQEIFSNLYNDGRLFNACDVIDFLDSHPEYLLINKNVNQKKLGE
jgi:spore coat polysaccharide biosynthesis protein SpsF